MTLEEQGKHLIQSLDGLLAKQAESRKLMIYLRRSAKLYLQGIHPGDLKSWGYDAGLDKRRHSDFYEQPEVWNFVTLRDGTRVNLDPPIPRDGLCDETERKLRRKS